MRYRNGFACSCAASFLGAAPHAPAYAASPFDLGVPANQTCAVLWDEDGGAFSREALERDGKIVLRIPDTEESRALFPELAGKSIEMDIDALHRLPQGMTPDDTIVLGTLPGGEGAYTPHAFFDEIVGCLPCPDLHTG